MCFLIWFILCVLSKMSFPEPKIIRVYSRRFIILVLYLDLWSILSSLLYVTWDKSSRFIFLYMRSHLFLHDFLEKVTLSLIELADTFVKKINLSYTMGLFLDSLFCPIVLDVYPYIIITVWLLQCYRKSWNSIVQVF